jgi:hypothetical protein
MIYLVCLLVRTVVCTGFFGSSFVLFIDNRIQPQGPAVRAMHPMAPQLLQPGRTPHLVIHDGWVGVFRNRHRLVSALLEHISLQPRLETFRELFASAGKVVFCSKGNTLGRPLVLRDVGLVLVVHDELALPDTRKGQFPEIAVRQKAHTGHSHCIFYGVGGEQCRELGVIVLANPPLPPLWMAGGNHPAALRMRRESAQFIDLEAMNMARDYSHFLCKECHVSHPAALVTRPKKRVQLVVKTSPYAHALGGGLGKI